MIGRVDSDVMGGESKPTPCGKGCEGGALPGPLYALAPPMLPPAAAAGAAAAAADVPGSSRDWAMARASSSSSVRSSVAACSPQHMH